MFSKQALRRLILPLIIEQFLAVMVGMADIMMVSSAGEAAVSSVALVDLINVLIINIFAALATGGAVVCAQSIGAQNLERANRAANQLLYIVTAAALGIMVLVLFCKAGLLGLLFGQVEPEVMEGAVTYFVISALSYPFIAVYNGCAALLRAMGNSKASMCVSAYMNGQNIAGNAVFVFVFHQGVAGVALSSLLSRIAAAGLMLALLHGRRNPVPGVRPAPLPIRTGGHGTDSPHRRAQQPGKQLLSTGPGAAGEPDLHLRHGPDRRQRRG